MKMNWKIVVGLVIVAGILAVGIFAMGTHTKITNISVLDGGNNTDDGPHPPGGDGSWIIWNPGYQVLDGPHPPGGDGSW